MRRFLGLSGDWLSFLRSTDRNRQEATGAGSLASRRKSQRKRPTVEAIEQRTLLSTVHPFSASSHGVGGTGPVVTELRNLRTPSALTGLDGQGLQGGQGTVTVQLSSSGAPL